MGGAAGGERVESDLGGGVLGLAEGGAVVRALESLAVKVNDGLEPRRVVRTFSNGSIRREVEATPLRQLLKLVFIHLSLFPFLFSLSSFSELS